MSPLFRRDKKEEPAQVIAGLRSQALSVSPTDLDIHPSAARPNVWGVLMETGYPEAVASLVVFADGSTSLYFSNGGGIIGAGEHRSVRLSGEEFLSAVEQHFGQFVPASDTPLPEQGQVRFYIRAFDGIKTALAAEDDLGEGRHLLSRVFHSGHAVIAALRETQEGMND